MTNMLASMMSEGNTDINNSSTMHLNQTEEDGENIIQSPTTNKNTSSRKTKNSRSPNRSSRKMNITTHNTSFTRTRIESMKGISMTPEAGITRYAHSPYKI